MTALFVDVRAAADRGEATRIVFVHGAMDRSTSFAKVRARLSAYETVAYDRRGYARSLGAGPARSFTGHVDDLEAVVDGHPCVLVGHSYGGNLALALAELRPKDRWVAMSFSLPRVVRHRLITRKVMEYSGRFYHVANLRGPDDLDEELRNWLTEAYQNSPT